MHSGIKGCLPVSPVQEGILFDSLYDPSDRSYVTQWQCTLEVVDGLLLKEAWDFVADRHPILRTTFQWDDAGQPLQIVRPRTELAWTTEDWRGLAAGQQEERWVSVLHDDRRQGFVPASTPPMRFQLVRLDDTTSRFLWTSHRALLDSRSRGLVVADVLAVFQDLMAARDPAVPARPAYEEYLTKTASCDVGDTEAFWRERLSGIRLATALGADGRLGAVHSDGRDGWRRRRLTVPTSESLLAAARDHDVAIETLLCGAWSIVLARASGDSRVCFGVTVPDRGAGIAGIDEILGALVVTVPLIADVSAAAPLWDWLGVIQAERSRTAARGHVPLSRLHSWSGVPGGLPLVETLLLLDDRGAEDHPSRVGTSLRDVICWERSSCPLTLAMLTGKDVTLSAAYDGQRFDCATVDRVLAQLARILTVMADGRDLCVGDVPILPEAERRRLVVERNHTAAPFPQRCLHELVEEQVTAIPNGIAVVDGPAHTTYAELDRQANQLAHYLQTIGAGPDVPVGLHLERSTLLVTALLAVLKAGSAYLPLDIEAPGPHLAELLADAKPALCLTQRRHADRLPADLPTVLCLDDEDEHDRIAGQPETSPAAAVGPDNLVSVYYTSGSTGRPKGVANVHRGWVNRMVWMQRQHPLRPGERVLQKTTLTFDDAAVEFFWPLTSGGTIALLGPELHRDHEAIKHAAIEHGVTALQFVPSWLAAFLDQLGPDDLDRLGSLRHVVSSGEALRPAIIRLFMETLGPRGCALHNQWGPTEVSIDATLHTCTPADGNLDGPVPIGTPIANDAVYVLDERLEPVPVGAVGELYLAGAGLARGYLHDPARTAEVFLPSPFGAGERLYKTGDRGYWRGDGSIVFLGRRDGQVKLRGIRIELGDVEHALAGHSAVDGVVVSATDDTRGELQLVAYVVGHPVDPPALRAYLRERVPEYMVPAQFVELEQLPFTASGKVDRRGLPPAPLSGSPAKGRYLPPRTPVELELSRIWSEVIGAGPIGVQDDFFELGGHSLLATRVIARVRAAFAISVPLRELLDRPTVAELARVVEQAVAAEVADLSEEDVLAFLREEQA
jgi:amino acid adenylation domain-containing protein